MVKTLPFQCRRYGFDPWLGNKIPHASWCARMLKKIFVNTLLLKILNIIGAFSKSYSFCTSSIKYHCSQIIITHIIKMKKFEMLQELQNMTQNHEVSKRSRENRGHRLPGHRVAPICKKCDLCKGKEAIKAKNNKMRCACISELAFGNGFQSIRSSSTYSVLETNPWCCGLRSSTVTKTHT